MDRIYDLLNNVEKSLKQQSESTILPVPVTTVEPSIDPNTKPGLKPELIDQKTNDDSLNSQKQKIDLLKTKNPVEELPEHIGYIVGYKTTNAGQSWTVDQYLRKTEDQLTLVDSFDDYGLADITRPPTSIMDYDIEEADEENETPETEMTEYKNDFFEMSVGSLRAIAAHAQKILESLDNPSVKENLTESWLQGKIAITEDYMRTIHDFIMFVTEAADTISAADRPGLWENIRKKKEKEGKNYKPAKPGDKDRPDPEQWKKLTKKSKS